MGRREMRVEAEPWDRVAGFVEPGERPLARSPGWLVGNAIDLPCTVFLTDRHLILSTQPWMPGDAVQLVANCLGSVQRCGIGSAGRRRKRLVYVTESQSTRTGIEGFVIDLPPGGQGRRFAELVVDTVRRP